MDNERELPAWKIIEKLKLACSVSLPNPRTLRKLLIDSAGGLNDSERRAQKNASEKQMRRIALLQKDVQREIYELAFPLSFPSTFGYLPQEVRAARDIGGVVIDGYNYFGIEFPFFSGMFLTTSERMQHLLKLFLDNGLEIRAEELVSRGKHRRNILESDGLYDVNRLCDINAGVKVAHSLKKDNGAEHFWHQYVPLDEDYFAIPYFYVEDFELSRTSLEIENGLNTRDSFPRAPKPLSWHSLDYETFSSRGEAQMRKYHGAVLLNTGKPGTEAEARRSCESYLPERLAEIAAEEYEDGTVHHSNEEWAIERVNVTFLGTDEPRILYSPAWFDEKL